jgi:hypothetical protein
MNPARIKRVLWMLALPLFSTTGCTSAADCTEAKRVAREAMVLMADTARDESTKLRHWVRDGWDSPFDDLTIIRSVQIGSCAASGDAAEVEVEFAVLGRLLAAGQEHQVRFEPGTAQERRLLRVVAAGQGAWKLDDITHLEPHVTPHYAIRVLSEMANGDRLVAARIQTVIGQLRDLDTSDVSP